MLQEDSAYRQFTTDYRNSVSSIASNHDLSSLCYRRIQHTDNLRISVGIPVCLLLLVTDYRNWCWDSSVSSIASNHDLSSLCYRRIQHTDNLPLIIGIGVGFQCVFYC